MSIYNEDELVPPSWMNEIYFENILNSYFKCDNIKLLKYDVSPASVKGDHFASIMFRIKVEYTNSSSENVNRMSLILKTLPELEGIKKDMLGESKLFETEISMYGETLPLFESILQKYGDNTKFGPKMIYSSLTPNKVIIFEDLCELGYDTIRGRCLKYEELLIVLERIAKLHAVSYKLAHSEPSELVTKYDYGFFCDDKIIENDMISGGLAKFKNFLESMENFKRYAEKFKNIQSEIYDKCKKLYRIPDAEAICVLNHGDFHMKNMMFKFNSQGEFENVMLVDFQLSVFGPSNIDLMYAMYMLYDPETRLEKTMQLSYYYFEKFLETLKNIQFLEELPKYSKFQMSNLKYRHFALFLVATFLPMVHLMFYSKPEDMKDLDITSSVEDQQFLEDLYKNPNFIKELEKLLPKLMHEGYMD